MSSASRSSAIPASCSKRRAFHRSVDLDRSPDDPAHTALGKVADQRRRLFAGGFGPALCGRHPAAGVDPNDDLLSVGIEHVVEEVGVGQRGGADHDPLGACIQGALDREGVTEASAELNARVRPGSNAPHVIEIGRGA